MSIEASAWAWSQKVDLPSIKLVLLALADHADKQGRCWPSVERIGDMTGLSQPTIWRAMTTLTDMGMVQQRRRGRSYSFELCLTNTIHDECNQPDDTIHGEMNSIHGESDTIHGEMDSIQDECLTVKNHQKPPKEPRETKHRLSADWRPDDRLLLWAQERAPHVDTTLETERFLDHFVHIKPDRRTDQGWCASWRNWILRARRDYTPAAARFPTRSERTTQRNATILGDALADRSASHDSVRNLPGLPFRLIEGGRNGAD